MKPVAGKPNRFYYTLTEEQEPKGKTGWHYLVFLLKTPQGTGSYGDRESRAIDIILDPNAPEWQYPKPIPWWLISIPIIGGIIYWVLRKKR